MLGGQFNGGRKVMLGGQFNGGRMVVTEVVSLMEGEWSKVGHKWKENGHVTEVVTNGGRMVILRRWSV